MKLRNLMILGTASGVGKSIIAAGFCRLLSNAGYKVAPFKAQNMSNNSFVAEAGEMGRAQAVQAECARIHPHVDMNPVLLKPGCEDGSQVIVQGKVVGSYKARKYFADQAQFFTAVQDSFVRLNSQYEVIVLEGAGSPAEVNLKRFDMVNFKSAELADAQCVLVADIDRGGVFASVIGTLDLLEPSERQRIAGILINKFRGDISLFDDGVKFIEERTGIKVLGVVPFDPELHIMEEDSVPPQDRGSNRNQDSSKLDIAILYLPHVSNFTDFEPLLRDPNVQVRYVRHAAEIRHPDLLIIPGTKATVSDFEYLKDHGFEPVIREYQSSGGRLLGICGGFQMMGDEVLDALTVESRVKKIKGFGFLRMRTEFFPEKTLKSKRVRIEARLFGRSIHEDADIYEIHMGKSFFDQNYDKFGDNGVSEGNIVGTYYHGLFDHDEFRAAFLKALADASGKNLAAFSIPGYSDHKELQYDRLAGLLAKHVDLKYLGQKTGLSFEASRLPAAVE